MQEVRVHVRAACVRVCSCACVGVCVCEIHLITSAQRGFGYRTMVQGLAPSRNETMERGL